MPITDRQITNIANLSAADAGDTPKRLYTFTTNDTAAVVQADGYFDGRLNNGLNAGDVLLGVLDDDGTVALKFYLVTVGGADVTVIGQGGTIAALTYDLVAGATPNNALQAIPDLTDSPATADALRDDLVANTLPAIRNNMADICAKVEAIRAILSV